MMDTRCSRLGIAAIFVLMGTILSGSFVQANVIGSGNQNFNTITSGLDFVTVQSSQTLAPGVVNLGLFLNDAINSLPYLDTQTQGRTNFNDNLLGMDLNLGIGIAKNWDAGFSVPSIIEQSVSSTTSSHGEFAKTGLTEVRLNTKYRLLGDDTQGVALVGSVNLNLTQDNPYAGVNPGPTWNLEVAADTTIKQVRVALNLGHRWLNSGLPVPNAPILPQGNQIIASTAASYLIPHTDTKAILEIYGSRPDSHTDNYSDRTASSLELLVGLKHDYTTQLAVHAGVGTDLINGLSSPDWRIYTGLNYTFGPIFAKKEVRFEIVKTAEEERLVSQNIPFEFNSDKLTPDAEKTLEDVVAFIRSADNQNISKIVIEGHTDSVGSEKYNLELSQRRANSIRTYLMEKYSFKPKQLEAIGYGPNRPIADNGNFQGRQLNRRVEFKLER